MKENLPAAVAAFMKRIFISLWDHAILIVKYVNGQEHPKSRMPDLFCQCYLFRLALKLTG